MSILYITYDGILEPLGQSQVLAYQEKLGKNFKIFLFSFELQKETFCKFSLNLRLFLFFA